MCALPIDVKNSINSQLPRVAEKQIQKIVMQKFLAIKNEMIKNFDNHPVTIEIESGSNAANTSGTLSGYGNLFTFIGFPDGFDPVSPIRNRLLLTDLKKIKYNRGIFDFSTTEPTREELFAMTKFSSFRSEMQGGRSWLDGIETGISGLGFYLYEKGRDISKSRSGPAIQLKGGKASKEAFGSGATGGAISTQRSRYKRVSYISSILREFKYQISKLANSKI